MIVYDVTNRDSFTKIREEWLKMADVVGLCEIFFKKLFAFVRTAHSICHCKQVLLDFDAIAGQDWPPNLSSVSVWSIHTTAASI